MTDPAETRPAAGQPERLAPGLARILAPNPSPMTFRGTNSYLLSCGADRAVIDPGPDDPAHLAALLGALQREGLTMILVTHAHRDHSALAPALARATGAPVLAFGNATAGRSAVMTRLAAAAPIGGGEGIDAGFTPDRCLADGEILPFGDGRIEALHTPGHMGNHLAFAWRDAIFTGDLVMGWASSLVSPPDGDLADFLRSCARLRARPETVLHPGHGPAIPDPAARIDTLLAHRHAREAQILDALARAPADLSGLTARVYEGTPPALWPAAARNLLAHLVELVRRELVLAEPALSATARFSLRQPEKSGSARKTPLAPPGGLG
ncbi:MBL fold metallo-hydrolase [Mangrovicoccus algicola]|uniref:MBL fold metallo-hydrolase n=1 Tax=Mangrovicoccus algicola TaxID=2771008 RepID=A0A8J6Z534_9RHOB|nr:MBL fold metallo-hydrolase [Mangrovicoccus algicola]MBE3637839.1 MBL fold metallo-hydrolase [Mangrovicoccus algicola]